MPSTAWLSETALLSECEIHPQAIALPNPQPHSFKGLVNSRSTPFQPDPIRSPMLSSAAINPRLPALARICGLTMLLVFAASVFFALFPLELGSPLWGTQLSSRIIDAASLPLVAATLLCAAAFLQPMPEDPDAAPRRVMVLGRQRLFALRLCRAGMVSLALLALWQLVLLIGNTGQINRISLSQSTRISPAIEKAEQRIRQASPAQLELPWQRFVAAGAPGLKQSVAIATTEQKRQALLAAIKAEQQQLDRRINSQGDQARLLTVRDTLRRVALCFIYAGGFFALWRCLA